MAVAAYGSAQSILVDQGEAKIVEHLLMPNEGIKMTIKQRKFGPGGDLLTPTTLVATDKRLIIVYRASFGMRKYFEVIPYRRITSVRIEHGLISSSLHFHVLGSDSERHISTGKLEGVVDGLRAKQATEFGRLINSYIMDIHPGSEKVDTDFDQEDAIYCRSCGAKELSSSKFCAKCGQSLDQSTKAQGLRA